MKKVKMLNAHFANSMWVAEDRVEEYKAAGHKLAASTAKPAAEKPEKAEKSGNKK